MIVVFKKYKLLLIPIVMMAFVSCSGLSGLQYGEYLYTGAKIEYTNSLSSSLENEIENVVKPKPNSKLLGMRPKLTLYYLAGDKDKGFSKLLKNKIGEKPILFKNVKAKKTALLIENRLENNGYFNSNVNYKIEKQKRKVSIKYFVDANVQYLIDTLIFPQGSSSIENEIRKTYSSSLLKKDNSYNLEVLKKERKRIDKILKNKGYYFFNPDYLIFQIDSSVAKSRLNVYLKLKDETPDKAKFAYKINNVFVYADYSLGNLLVDTSLVDGKYYISKHKIFRPNTILNAVYFQQNKVYSRNVHNLTYKHLMALDVYKYIEIKIVQDSISKHSLNIKLLLTPKKKISVDAELSAVSKSNNFAGPGIKFSFTDRNFFKGAEKFNINLDSRLETQISGNNKWNNSYNIGLTSELSIPRFVPLKSTSYFVKFVPLTKINLGYNLFNRINYFKLNSLKFTFKYKWKANASNSHTLKPLVIDFVDLVNSSSEFEKYLDKNPIIRKSFEEQFILGSGYEFSITNLKKSNLKLNYAFKGSLDLSGNLLNLFATKAASEDIEKVFGVVYSQFLQIKSDFRLNQKISKKSKFAFRLFSGIGLPYGNSTTLPYLKQFFIGGTNSLRAFTARSVGPGEYLPDNTGTENIYFDQTGDIKLETNLEYRFGIYSIFKGALFVDAGNIWLLNEDKNRKGAEIIADKIIDQLAIGTGLGLRIDVTFFVLRFDLAFPVRKPYMQDKWVYDKINLASKNWRKENLILNIAIGYPF